MNNIGLEYIEHITDGHARNGKNVARKKEASTRRQEKKTRPRHSDLVIWTMNR